MSNRFSRYSTTNSSPSHATPSKFFSHGRNIPEKKRRPTDGSSNGPLSTHVRSYRSNRLPYRNSKAVFPSSSKSITGATTLNGSAAIFSDFSKLKLSTGEANSFISNGSSNLFTVTQQTIPSLASSSFFQPAPHTNLRPSPTLPYLRPPMNNSIPPNFLRTHPGVRSSYSFVNSYLPSNTNLVNNNQTKVQNNWPYKKSGLHPHKASISGFITSLEECIRAVEVLYTNDRIAVDCEGVLLSRTGRLCLLQLAAPDAIYIIDLVGNEPNGTQYAQSLFHKGGLKRLLEDSEVVKVMHDCRHDSDALYHQFGVKLGPVIDTQVAFSVLRRVRGMEEGLPVSLRTLLKKFQYASEGDLELKTSVKESIKGDDGFWLKRPLSERALCYARFDVEHLLKIAHVLAKLISSVDRNGWQNVLNESQCYLQVFRNDEHGPKRAQQQFEQRAREAHRRRTAFEQSKKMDLHRLNDPLRSFTFDHGLVLESLTS